MTTQEVIDEIKLELTGGVLELELPDTTLELTINKALREIQQYIDSTELMTVPYASCIDLSDSNVSSVTKVYRTEGYDGASSGSGIIDPMYAQQWMIFSNGGTMYNLNDYVMNYLSWTTLLQMRNTTSTDLQAKEVNDKNGHKLYITCRNVPEAITIEYIPVCESVEDVKSSYWIDVLIRLSVALTKVTLGRIRSRYVQSNALWTQDGDTLLAEGNKELEDLRTRLKVNSQIIYPQD